MRTAILGLSLAVCTVCIAATQTITDAPTRFADQVRNWGNDKFKVSPEEALALRQSHRILRAIADDPHFPLYFWQAVRQEPAQQMTWDEAANLVRKGEIVMAAQTHALHVDLLSRDGREYKTTEPRIDEILKVVREVDPKQVFIQYITE
jgi:hypothetical protein